MYQYYAWHVENILIHYGFSGKCIRSTRCIVTSLYVPPPDKIQIWKLYIDRYTSLWQKSLTKGFLQSTDHDIARLAISSSSIVNVIDNVDSIVVN